MIRLFVTVWKDTVAIAWQTTTIRMTRSAMARRSAMRQNPAVPNSMGLPQARMPAAEMSASALSTPIRIQ